MPIQECPDVAYRSKNIVYYGKITDFSLPSTSGIVFPTRAYPLVRKTNPNVDWREKTELLISRKINSYYYHCGKVHDF